MVGLLSPIVLWAKEPVRPNILWITIEDTSPHFLGCYGNSDAKTPNIDELADKGVRFTRAFATGAVCSSSRSTIVTGLYTGQLGTGNHRSKYEIPKEIRGFPALLREAGYYTTNNKKLDYNIANMKPFVADAWNESSGQAGWWGRGKDQPFFAVFNFMSSHQSRTMTNPWNWYEHFVLEKLGEQNRIGPGEFEMPPFYRDTPEMRKYMSRVYNSLSYTDQQVGELLGRLKKDGLMENTIIFFYADHGEGIPRGKCNPVALGYRVPFIVWAPDKYRHLLPWKNDSVASELVSFVDLAPTVLSLGGLEKPEYMPGRAIMGDNRENSPELVYASRNRIDESPGLARSVTDGRFIYTRIFMPHLPELKYQKYADVSDIVKQIRLDYRKGHLNPIQSGMLEKRPIEVLYDLENDPWEINNLAQDARYESVLQKFRAALKSQIEDIKDVHFLPESVMLKRAEGSNIYRMRQNRELNPIKTLYSAASLVGREDSMKKQFELLKHPDAAVRYWASLGLKNQELPVESKKEIEEVLENENAPEVRIELSSILYNRWKCPKGFNVLSDMAVSENLIISNQALQAILYLSDFSEFIPIAKKVLYLNKDRSGGLSYEVKCGAEMILFKSGNHPLNYAHFKKWMN
ncbi:sulfatase family protein [Marinilabilia rubra]|nr:sulfatase [Marinilabilia rubra]